MERAPGGVGEEDARAAARRLGEEARRPRERPARARRADEGVDAPARLRPDLRACRRVVPGRVRGVVKLVRPEGARGRRGVVSGAERKVLRVRDGDGRDGTDVRAQRSQEVGLLTRLRVGHENDTLEAARVADVGEADARVACSPFDDSPPRLQPSRHGILDQK